MVFADMKNGRKINFISTNIRFSIKKMEENKKNHLRRSFIQKELNIIYTQDCYAHINHYIMTYDGYSKTGQVLTQYN